MSKDIPIDNSLFSKVPLDKFIIAVVIVCLAMRLHLAFVYQINWDEFLHLAKVYEHQRGDLGNALQSIYVHLFHWVKWVPGFEVNQIIAARLVIFGSGLATAWFLYRICRQLLDLQASLFAVLSYVSFSFVLTQANSFRTDPIAACLLMMALWIVVCRAKTLSHAMIAGALIGLAGMVTIKSILYVPTIGIILLIELYAAQNRRSIFLYGLVAAITALVSFAVFYLLHDMTLTRSASATEFVGGATSMTIGGRNFENAKAIFSRALAQNPVFWITIILGIGVCARQLFRSPGPETKRWLLLLAFGVILASLFVYPQSFPYFYPFMLAPAAVLCGVTLAALPSHTRLPIGTVAVLVISLFAALSYATALQRSNAAQRQTLEVVHRAFPEPVPYIDRCSMVSAFPKRGFFMSVWGFVDYYRTGEPVMQAIVEKDQPRFLLANRSMLDLDALGPDEFGPAHFGLFKPDVEILKANYIRHWGALYVAGKKFSFSSNSALQEFEMLIEGTYTIESDHPVLLDGKSFQPGDVVQLATGPHQMQMAQAMGNVTLRWGDHLYRPENTAPDGPLFNGF